ncbi:MAG: hypothetical protein C0399_09990 [Syntrophus sp. (in: bacteria)]|nr:hypothetical protein [Syntrophus sp. (in: bacteria)]MBA4418576.1 hypothetical protein [Syntrophus sp. (in: bacteria)]
MGCFITYPVKEISSVFIRRYQRPSAVRKTGLCDLSGAGEKYLGIGYKGDKKMKMVKCVFKYIAFTVGLAIWTVGAAYAIDSDVTRRTLAGIQGVNVVVEELQPNIQKYTQKFGLQREQIKTDVEAMLRKAGVTVFAYEQWLKTPGRPFLYIVVNTHEYEKYWYSYDVRVELKQGVSLEVNPLVKTMAGTWGINMTGITNIGKLNAIKESINVLVGRFIEAYLSVNLKK